MWHVPIFCNNLEALNCFSVADDIVEVDWAVLLDPAALVSRDGLGEVQVDCTKAIRNLLLQQRLGLA